jgi:hypothetical protein
MLIGASLALISKASRAWSTGAPVALAEGRSVTVSISTLLEAVTLAVQSDSTISALVDSEIHRDVPLELADTKLKSASKTCILITAPSWESTIISEAEVARPVFQVAVISRKQSASTYALDVADKVSSLLAPGVEQMVEGILYRIDIDSIDPKLCWEKKLKAWVALVNITGRYPAQTAPTISSLTPNLASPKVAGEIINWVCVAADSDSLLLYKFWLKGPGTGGTWRDMTSWTRRNSWSWRTSEEDVGENEVKVQIIDESHAASWEYDDQATLSFTVTSAVGSAPSIVSLVADPGSPQRPETNVVLICEATDPNDHEILYRFWLKGPATADRWQDMTNWTRKNSWTWKPSAEDVGANQIKVHVIDGNHEGRGSYDDEEIIDFTVSENPKPAITSLTPYPASPQVQETDITLVCVAAGGGDDDQILYRFWLKGPATAGEWADMTGWSSNNAAIWKTSELDIGTSQIRVQVIDGNHADRGGYDDLAEIFFTISPNTTPAISDLITSRDSPQIAGEEIIFVCLATAGDEDEILYKFWLKGAGTADEWADQTGWQGKNSWTWKPTEDDAGSNEIRVQVIDGNHADRGGCDDSETLSFTITPLELSSVTPSLASPQANETTIVFTASANRTSNLVYRFWLNGPGTGNVWRDMTGWIQTNSWEWRTKDCDVGSNTVRVQVIDKRSNWDDNQTTGRQIDTAYIIA